MGTWWRGSRASTAPWGQRAAAPHPSGAPTDEEGSREGRRPGCAGSGGQSRALRGQPGPGTSSNGTPVLAAGRGAARGLPRLQWSPPAPPRVAGRPKRSGQTGAGGRAGMIPALIISVPPYTNAAARSLRRSAAKRCARWTQARATGSAQKLPVQHSQPAVAPLAKSGSPSCPLHIPTTLGRGTRGTSSGCSGTGHTELRSYPQPPPAHTPLQHLAAGMAKPPQAGQLPRG